MRYLLCMLCLLPASFACGQVTRTILGTLFHSGPKESANPGSNSRLGPGVEQHKPRDERAESRDESTIRFEVHETAGIRRRNAVVSTQLALTAPVLAETRFYVLRGGKPIVSQIRLSRSPAGRIKTVDIDFIDSFAPLEAREYELQLSSTSSRKDVEPNTGFELRETDEAFHISNLGRIDWTVRKDLKGLLRFRLNPDVEYVQADSAGLVFRATDGTLHRLTDQKVSMARVLRQGSIACAVEFEFSDWPKGSTSKVQLEFVRTRSWVHANWTTTGAQNVAGMGAELRLELDGEEKLIDFGADDFVYTTVRPGDTVVLDTAPGSSKRTARWTVLHGRAGALQPLVVGPPSQTASGVGGWAHVMDDSRCTAVVIGDCAMRTRDRIECDGTGRLLMYRDFGRTADLAKQKSLEFWIHFVGMPVHIGARTSPQAMRSPLQVRWLGDSIQRD